MKVLVIDDEPHAIKLLEQYLNFFKGLELLGSFRNGLNALEFVQKNPVDLVFLDIDMPHINGISLAKILPKTCKIIFTTAHSEHAVESYELNAADYLLKPISLERFSRSLIKVMALESSTQPDDQKNLSNKVVLKEKGSYHFVTTDQIYYLKKQGNQMNYFLEHCEISVRQNIQEAQSLLGDSILQIHKSILVNPKYVTGMDQDFLTINGQHLSIGPSYKDQIQQYFLNPKQDSD